MKPTITKLPTIRNDEERAAFGPPATGGDFLVTMTIKNNLLAKKMREYGVKSLSELAKLSGAPYPSVVDVSNLKISPYLKNKHRGNVYAKVYQDLAKFFKCLPEDICPEQLHYRAMDKNKITKESHVDIPQFLLSQSYENNPEIKVIEKQMIKHLHESMKRLTSRQERILKKRAGIECEPMTLAQVAKEENVTIERIRQFEQKTLRRLRHPSFNLQQFVEESK